MKYFISATPGPMPPTPEQLDSAIEWLEGKNEDGTFDCTYGYLEGGGFSIANADSHGEALDLMADYPLFGMVTGRRGLARVQGGSDHVAGEAAEGRRRQWPLASVESHPTRCSERERAATNVLPLAREASLLDQRLPGQTVAFDAKAAISLAALTEGPPWL